MKKRNKTKEVIEITTLPPPSELSDWKEFHDRMLNEICRAIMIPNWLLDDRLYRERRKAIQKIVNERFRENLKRGD